jgi:nitronate monooxygenase|tara:strand:+ start:186 stop:1244 length:1059 start_codon:yes stop_codon:yes gene_type:complete
MSIKNMAVGFNKLNLSMPIIQAPMAGGATSIELVAAVSNFGALGSFAAALLSPEAITQSINEIRSQTNAPFCVNLFVLDSPTVDDQVLASANQRLAPFREELGLPGIEQPKRWCQDNQAQMEALIDAAPAAASFAFGIPAASHLEALRGKGSIIMGTATNLIEARAWEDAGADAICLQGYEAGGHRSTFIGDYESSQLGIETLLKTVIDSVKTPLIAAGGIMTGERVKQFIDHGALACQLGTAFLTCREAGIHQAYKARLLASQPNETRVTRVFSGKPARGLVNQFMQRLETSETDIPDYPIQNALTTTLRSKAAELNNIDYMSLWAGTNAYQTRDTNVFNLLSTLREEMNR